jgi:eukaryotic translation initiation factor 2C
MSHQDRGRGRGRGRVAPPPARGGPPGGFRGGRGGAPATIFAGGTAVSLDPRHSDAALSSLISSLNSIQLNPESPTRPGWGTTGRPITLRANFFALRVPKKFLVYDYEVSITPDKDLRGPRKARIFELLEGSPQCAPHMGFIAHDSSQRLVSTRQLPQPLTITVTYTEAGQTQPATNPLSFVVKINFVRVLNMDDMTP